MSSSRKWKVIKVNVETYMLLRKIAALLGLRQYKVVYIALALTYLLLIGESDKAKQLLNMLYNRLESQKWMIERMMETLEEILQS